MTLTTDHYDTFISLTNVERNGGRRWIWDGGMPLNYANFNIRSLPVNRVPARYCAILYHTWSSKPCNELATYVCKKDVNECALGLHTCIITPTLMCTNTHGSYTCNCTMGYRYGTQGCQGKESSWPRDPFGRASQFFSRFI